MSQQPQVKLKTVSVNAKGDCPCCGKPNDGTVKNRRRKNAAALPSGRQYMTSCQECHEEDAGGSEEE